MNLAPARLEPRFVERIWGARSLAPLFPERSNLPAPVGEVWLTGDDCVFASGAFAGKRLADAWREMPPEWRGTRLANGGPFPLLVKFIFPEEKLSVQVHPGDAYAARHHGPGFLGKTEMWYALDARPGAEVMAGLRAGTTPQSFERAIADGTVEDCLTRIPVRAGDAVFVPAGTVHTIGPGMLLCEIQENSDITYRVFDYNRLTADGKPRELHVRQALEVANFGAQRGARVEPVAARHGDVTETFFIACRYFATEKWEFAAAAAAATSPEHFDLIIILDGAGRIEWAGQSVDYARAQVWLLPAALGDYGLVPAQPTSLLRTYVPDLENEFPARLASRKIPDAVRQRLIYP